jgi:PAS domain S-box-containing protein
VERELREAEVRRERKKAEDKVKERTNELIHANQTIRASNTLLRLLGTSVSRKEYLDEVVRLIQKWSGYRYVGIRVLNEDGTIPYEAYSGFSREFWKSECWLSVKHDQCICTRVVTGKPEPQDSPAMTAFGSFCSGDTFQFFDGLTEEEKKKFRAVCMKNGFASVSVTPVFYGGRIMAAIHLADKEKGKITREFLELLETLTPLIGEAIHKFDKDAERAHLLKAFESTSDAIAVTDREKIFRYVNPAFEQVTGYRSEEIIGNELSSVWGANGAESYDEVWNIMDKSGTWSGHLTGRRKDNTTYEEDTTISPVRDSFGAVINYIVTKRDVTERLRLESIAEAVNTMDNIGYVFAGVRHEIGNPVNSIKMTLNVLKKNLDKYGKDNILEYLDRALSESSRIEYLLKSFKNFNMFEKPEMQDVEIDPFMYNFHALVLGDSMRKGITVTRAVSEDAKSFYVDPRALQQVLLNIFANAMDACDGRKDPAIDISVSKIPDMIFIRITDNGRGMTAEQQKDLFKPFHTTKHHGTGLGLVICKKMLSKMNCFIEMQSIKDKGTTVDILIPEKKSE